MVSCKHCSTQNSLDSTFCKRCGTSLSEEALLEAQAKLDGLIEEGNSLFNLGRTEDAMAVADACVASNPTSVSALSLKALCHERKHQIAEALECAERIVELNPDSELDKIKRNALRTRLQAEVRIPEAPNRGLALVGATAAVVLVACLGVGIARITSKPAETTLVAQRDSVHSPNFVNEPVSPGVANLGTVNPVRPALTPSGGQTNASTPVNDNLTRTPGIGDVPPVGQASQPRPYTAGRNEDIPRFTGSQLPTANRTGENEIRPFDPSKLTLNKDPEGEVVNPRNPSLTQRDGEDPTPLPNGDGQSNPAPQSNANSEPVAVVQDPSQGIEINVKSKGNRANRAPSGGAPVSSNGLETLQRVGSQQYQLGNFSAAARSYEQAVRAGGDGILLNQRLGQAYERLGRSGDAAEAYRRCIAACDAAIANGSGSKSRHESVKATAEQALKVLQGG